jgi:hypothetical protein
MTKAKWLGPVFVTGTQSLNCSSNGNPRFRVTLSDGTETVTSSDSQCVYGIRNMEGNHLHPAVAIMVRFTRAGRLSEIRKATPLDTMAGSR